MTADKDIFEFTDEFTLQLPCGISNSIEKGPANNPRIKDSVDELRMKPELVKPLPIKPLKTLIQPSVSGDAPRVRSTKESGSKINRIPLDVAESGLGKRFRDPETIPRN